MMQTQTSFPQNVVIIGSGVGGLSTAIILAKLGFGVTVLEKNARPGGLMRSYTREGIECEVGVHYLGSLDQGQILRKFFDYLGVTATIPVSRMGENGIIDRYLYSINNETSLFDLPPGFDAFEENLTRAFPDQQRQIAQLVGPIRKSAEQLHSLELLYSPQSIGGDLSILDQSRPLTEILDRLQCSPGLRAVLAVPACWIGVPFEDCPAYYHNMALASYVSSSWRLEGSGAGMADALAARLKALGGQIITGVEVRDIHVQSRVVKGVVLQSGEYLPASTIIGAVHPKNVLAMLPPEAVKPAYRQRISNLKDTRGIFSVHARLDADAHPEIPHNIFKLTTDQDGNVPDLKYYQIRKSKKEGDNLLSILTSGKDEWWAPWGQTKSGRRGDAYREAKERHAWQLISEAEELLGSFKGLRILDVYTPLTIRDWVNSPGGSAYGVQRSFSQTLATALLNRTAVKGLSLAGQNVTAPGIIGTIMGSFSTVKLLLGSDEFGELVHV